VTGFWSEHGVTAGALVKENACVRWHGLLSLIAAVRTGDDGLQHYRGKKGWSTANPFTSEDPGILYSAFETIEVICRPPMKLLQALRASAKVEDMICVFCANGMGCRLLGQAYGTDFQRVGLLQIAFWLVNK
jgi:hypothetical protein